MRPIDLLRLFWPGVKRKKNPKFCLNGQFEESVLDFVVVCARVLPHITSMIIDEKKKYVLTNFEQVRKGGKAFDSDHFTQIMNIKLNFLPQKPIRKEIFKSVLLSKSLRT